MSGELSGEIAAENKAALLTEAKARAEQWFGRTTCLHITIGPARDETETIEQRPMCGPTVRTAATPRYVATYTAAIRHKWKNPTYGINKCGDCDEWAPR